ncbi:MAG: glutamine-hydrolyzing carbamoyl-phosphate synthase small subunit [Candidatus Brocadiales bacterium]
MKKRALLVLTDGALYEGWSFGAEGETRGEVVFNTGITGYQEVLTDPSYKGQIVTLTYPLVGNYGVNLEDNESSQLYLNGFIVKEYSAHPSNWRSKASLGALLKAHRIVGIQGLDTRALTRHIRDHGEQVGVISTEDLDPESLQAKAKGTPGLVGRDLVKEVTTSRVYDWDSTERKEKKGARFHVVVYDCGVKYNILRSLAQLGARVTVVPAMTGPEDVLSMEPDGILISNGPGDPEPIAYMIENIRGLLGKRPVMGICLGHQLMALALGLKTYKLKFGHHGGNHPVMDLSTRKVEITTQNHSFAVAANGGVCNTPFGRVEVSHTNLNDKSVEGLRCLDIRAFSVQHHPEAAPGPHDAGYMFKRFLEIIEARKET